MPHGPPRDNAVDRVTGLFYAVKPPGWRVRVQSAVAPADSQPEPDLTLVRGDSSKFRSSHPGPADIGLIVEIADTSAQRDTLDKPRIYAHAGVPLYWVVDLNARRVEVFAQPSGPSPSPAFTSRHLVTPPGSLELVLGGVKVADLPVDQLLG